MCSVEERQSSIKRKEQREKRAGFYVGGGCQTRGRREVGSVANLRDMNVKACWEMGGRKGAWSACKVYAGEENENGSKAKCLEVWRCDFGSFCGACWGRAPQ